MRVVKMKVNNDKISSFRQFMEDMQYIKQNLEGCVHYDFFNEKKNVNVYYSYTIWEDIKYLRKYKKSELYKEEMLNLKKFCIEEPKAWTIENVFNAYDHEE